MTKVSVVIPTYDRADLLRGALDDVITQTLRDIEVIVVDDGSRDHTQEVVLSCEDPRVRYEKRAHLGIPEILNEGFAVTKGEYVMPLFDDDRFEATLLEELAWALDSHESAAFAHCGVVLVDAEGAEKALYVSDLDEITPGRRFLTRDLLPGLHSPVTASTMVRRRVVGDSPYDVRFPNCADVELWLRLSSEHDVAYVRNPLLRIRERDPESEFVAQAARLVTTVLAAKRLYLPLTRDISQRRQIRRGWRREVMRTCAAEVLRARESGRSTVEIAELAEAELSWSSALAVHLMATLPRSLIVPPLTLAKMAWTARAPIRARRSRFEVPLHENRS